MARILVVDDDPAIRRALRAFLERASFAVLEAGDAATALELVTSDAPPDGIVCDVLMPGMSGLEFYHRLVERTPQLRSRVVFLTGANRDPAVHQPIELLGVPLLGKLDDLSLVVDALRVTLLRPAGS